MKEYTKEIIDEIEDYINIGISLSDEKDHNILLEKIVTVARNITNADAGTLFIIQDGHLVFKIIQNESLGIFAGVEGDNITLPPLEMHEKNVAAYCALHNKIVNINDVYNDKSFDFSGPHKYDNITGYHTQSMLVVPLEDYNSKVIGVLQLINSKNIEKNIIPFEQHHERIISALGSQAAISLSNMNYLQDITNLFDSFIEVIITAIDEQTPYNVNHTKNIAVNAENFVRYLNHNNITDYGYFDEARIKELVMAAWVHDIGKIAIPHQIMEKPTRLGPKYELVSLRLDFIETQLLLRYNGMVRSDNPPPLNEIKEVKDEIDYVRESKKFIREVNEPSFRVTEEDKKKIKLLGKKQYIDMSMQIKPWLTADEVCDLSIERGTLTHEERMIMQGHVGIGEKMLNKISFTNYYANVPVWAIDHHEFLDGSGYPKGKKGDQIPIEARILTILDIFDALVASDRPYKKAMTIEKALMTLLDMANANKLDVGLVKIFAQSKIWEIDTNLGSEYFEKKL